MNLNTLFQYFSLMYSLVGLIVNFVEGEAEGDQDECFGFFHWPTPSYGAAL